MATRRPGREADRREHGGRLSLAADSAPAAVLCRVSPYAIDRELCAAFKAHKLKEAGELRAALAAGADLRDRRGRRLRPLSAASLRKLIDTLAAILDDAIEDELIDRNPA